MVDTKYTSEFLSILKCFFETSQIAKYAAWLGCPLLLHCSLQSKDD
jgi:hypothetical protein